MKKRARDCFEQVDHDQETSWYGRGDQPCGSLKPQAMIWAIMVTIEAKRGAVVGQQQQQLR